MQTCFVPGPFAASHVSVWGERKGRPTKRERRQMERWREEN